MNWILRRLFPPLFRELEDKRAEVQRLQGELEKWPDRMIDVQLRLIVARALPYGRLKPEYTGIYLDHLDQVAAEIRRHAEFTLDERWELRVVAIEDFNPLDKLLQSTQVSVHNNVINDFECIIGAALAAKNSYQLLDTSDESD